MTIVGDHVFISSVEIIEPIRKHPEPVDGMDRTAGGGCGAGRADGRRPRRQRGSRGLFTWSRHGRIKDVVANRSHLIDHQDCEYSGGGTQICTGATNLSSPRAAPSSSARPRCWT